MEQETLITKAGQLMSQACERCAAGFPSQANARLVDLRILLNKELVSEAFEGPGTEKTDEASEG